MPIPPSETTYFKQARFSTRLPNHYRFSAAHYWIHECEPGVQRVGLTKFAARMLGDFVEITFSVEPQDDVHPGDSIGSIEGFKAISDVYCVGPGRWLRSNPAIAEKPELVDSDPYDRGWLYELSGAADSTWLDVGGYIELLKKTIDKILADEKQQEESC